MAAAAAWALTTALLSKLFPISSGSSAQYGNGTSEWRGQHPSELAHLVHVQGGDHQPQCDPIVRNGPARVQARFGRRRRWAALQLRDALCRETQQVVERGARERHLLGGRLHLDQLALARHDDVHVDLGGVVLAVVEVEQRRARNEPARHAPRPSRCSGTRSSRPFVDEATQRQLERHEAAGDRRAARAAVGLEHVAVDVHAARAERIEVRDRAQGATDQALDLDRAPVLAPARGVARLAAAGRRRQHPVLGREPSAAGRLAPAGHRLHDRRRADHPRTAGSDQRRPVRAAHEAGIDLVRGAAGPDARPSWREWHRARSAMLVGSETGQLTNCDARQYFTLLTASVIFFKIIAPSSWPSANWALFRAAITPTITSATSGDRARRTPRFPGPGCSRRATHRIRWPRARTICRSDERYEHATSLSDRVDAPSLTRAHVPVHAQASRITRIALPFRHRKKAGCGRPAASIVSHRR